MSTRLSNAGYLTALERSVARICEMAHRIDPSTASPSCEGWDVAALLAHLGGVHGWARGGLADEGRPQTPEPEGQLVDWYEDQARELIESLRAADPEAPAWSFAKNGRNAGFWIRRQAHETEMHRVDLALADGEHPAYDGELAADAVSEVFDVFLPRLHAKEAIAVTAPLRFVASDTGDQWLLQPSDEPGVCAYTHTRLQGDEEVACTAMSSASDLATGLWGRTPYDLWGVSGDRSVLDQLMRAGVTP